MKTIEINDTKIRVRATTPALIYYRQEANSDLIADLAKFEKENMEKLMEGDFSSFDSEFLLRMAWAMNKAEHYGESFPDFEEWSGEHQNLPITNAKFIMGIIEEATDGFFRSGKESGGKPEQEQKPCE